VRTAGRLDRRLCFRSRVGTIEIFELAEDELLLEREPFDEKPRCQRGATSFSSKGEGNVGQNGTLDLDVGDSSVSGVISVAVAQDRNDSAERKGETAESSSMVKGVSVQMREASSDATFESTFTMSAKSADDGLQELDMLDALIP